jgi:NADH-quinone oxidoreductase subunit L
MTNPLEQPGLFFVIATLLPLLSFAVLMVLSLLRWGLRPYAKNNSTVNGIFQFLGGAVPGRGPAYIALAAIALAFVCSATGFAFFLREAGSMKYIKNLYAYDVEPGEGHDAKDKKKDKKAKKDAHGEHEQEEAKPGLKQTDKVKKSTSKKTAKQAAKEKKAADFEAKKADDLDRLDKMEKHWQDSFVWARIWPGKVSDNTRGTILKLGFRIDMLSAIMFVMVTFIATLIHLFSIGYISDELRKTVEDHQIHTAHGHYERRGRFGRFFMFLSLFCFSMLNLVLADNLLQIFVSWELVGICSFLLIGFYYERTSASNAANKAFITNRIGDAGFIIGLMIVWTYFGTFNFEEIFAQVRFPKFDSHKSEFKLKVDGVRVANRIVRGNLEDRKGDLYLKFDNNGDYALLVPGHIHVFQQGEIEVHAEPKRNHYSFIPYWMLVAAGLGIFLGCVGKSAQVPLQVWLPDAMEGPTPVSALIHAATMVAAGVYLVGRCYPLFTPEVLITIAYTGAITLFVAATTALVLTDIKKVLAYSTVSQLGYMMLGLGVGGWSAGLLHLLTHAFFKALLFLGSGSVIYGCHHEQDMQKMGGLFGKMKITALTMLTGVLAISGIPLFSGWYSKDDILAGALGFSLANREHFLLFLLPLLTAGLTTFYMFRLWFMTFAGKPRDEHVHEHANESPWTMTLPLVLLAILSVCVAWGWPIYDAHESWVGNELKNYSQPKSVEVDFADAIHETHEYHALAGALAFGVVAVGLVFAVLLYLTGVLDPHEAKQQFAGLHKFLTHKWYFDELYSAVLVRPSLVVAGWCRNFDLKFIDGLLHGVAHSTLFTSRWSGRFDKGIIDGLANLVADVSYQIGIWLRNVQTGYLRSYVLFLALAAMGIFVLLYAWSASLGGGP